MGFWKRLRRPRCGGMYIEDDILYTQRSWREPGFMLQVTPQEQAEFRRPVPYELRGARAKIEPFKGAPTTAVGVVIGPVLPIVPVGGKKTFVVTVVLGDGQHLVGWTYNGKQALRFWKAVNKGAKRRAKVAGPQNPNRNIQEYHHDS